MGTSDIQRIKDAHLTLINEKFDELDILVHDYLVFTRNRGGTLGFCVGGIAEKLRMCRMSLNDMCGKLAYHRHCPKTGTIQGRPVNDGVLHSIVCTNVWHNTNSDTLELHWAGQYRGNWTVDRYSLPRTTLRWRHHILEVEAHAERIGDKASTEVAILHDGVRYLHTVSDPEDMSASEKGDALPVLFTKTHMLRIRAFIHGMTLTDVPLTASESGTTDAFRVVREIDRWNDT